MLAERLSLALSGGDLILPETGRIAVFAPRAGADMAMLPKDRAVIVTGFRPDHDAFTAMGLTCARRAEGAFSAAVVCLPRAKALGRALMAQACLAVPAGGLIVVDGQKTDGIESMLRDLRGAGVQPAVLSKAHGKILWFSAQPMPAGWTAPDQQRIAGDFTTAPGVFSADGIDPASQLLADHLPEKLGAHLADLGAGWGYLAARILMRDTVKSLDLVEADAAALDCARINITDSRARFHWADATTWQPATKLDAVIMNPPFHNSRAADPDLGRAFIAAAAGMLNHQGRLWMVANRHLPYETALTQHFTETSEVAGDNRFKILTAARPITGSARTRR
jgi:16S rRNA (guanine1207-N2)-methyltransferase